MSKNQKSQLYLWSTLLTHNPSLSEGCSPVPFPQSIPLFAICSKQAVFPALPRPGSFLHQQDKSQRKAHPAGYSLPRLEIVSVWNPNWEGKRGSKLKQCPSFIHSSDIYYLDIGVSIGNVVVNRKNPFPVLTGTYSLKHQELNNKQAIWLILKGNLNLRVTWDPGRQARDSEMEEEDTQEPQPGWEWISFESFLWPSLGNGKASESLL